MSILLQIVPTMGWGCLCYVAMVANMQTIAKAIPRPIMTDFVLRSKTEMPSKANKTDGDRNPTTSLVASDRMNRPAFHH